MRGILPHMHIFPQRQQGRKAPQFTVQCDFAHQSIQLHQLLLAVGVPAHILTAQSRGIQPNALRQRLQWGEVQLRAVMRMQIQQFLDAPRQV